MNPFDFVNAINQTKQDLFEDPLAHKDYKPFLVNRGLSYFYDTIEYANMMNIRPDIHKDWQFYFLLNSISKKKRYSPWSKKDKDGEAILLVKEYFGYSSEKAKEALNILTEKQLKQIEQKLEKGGK